MSSRLTILFIFVPLMLMNFVITQPTHAQTEFDCATVTDVTPETCQALVALYNNTDGANWFLSRGWLVNTTVCEWEGVGCLQNQVTDLDLSSVGLNGSLPFELGNLSQLETLLLPFNPDLTGRVPNPLSNLTNLTELRLESTGLSGPIPADFATNLTDLQIFRFNRTDLCELDSTTFQTWLNGIGTMQSTDLLCTLQLDKQAPSTVLAGGRITYTLSLTNLSSITPANGIILADTLPTLVAGTDYRNTGIDLAAGATFGVTLTGTVAADASNNTVITNTANYTHSSGNGSASATTTVSNPPTPPTITSQPLETATVDLTYNYPISFSDANGDSVVITATTVPTWVSLVDITATSARLTGVPIAAQLGQQYPIVLQVTDSTALSDTQTFSLTVKANEPPQLPEITLPTAIVAIPYQTVITATDPDVGEILSISVITRPMWLSFQQPSNTTARLSGTPPSNVAGTAVTLTLQISDTAGFTDTQSYLITVDENTPPQFSSTPVTTATVGNLYAETVQATDADSGDSLFISAPTLPNWLALIDNADGTADLSGTPGEADIGANPVQLFVTDTANQTDTQAFTVEVSIAATPQPTPTPLPNGAVVATITPDDGGFLLSEDGFVNVSFPANAVTQTVEAIFVYQTNLPSTGDLVLIDNKAFDLEIAVNGVSVEQYDFAAPVLVIVTFTPPNDIDSDTVGLYRWDGTAWVQEGILSPVVTDFSVTASVTRFSTFAVLAERAASAQTAYLPMLVKQAAPATATPTATSVAPTLTATPSPTSAPVDTATPTSSAPTPTPPSTLTPTATPSRPTTQPPTATNTPIPNRPDLVIDTFTLTDLNNGNYRIDITARNQATTDVPFGNNFYIAVYVDDINQEPIRFWGVQAAWFAAGQTYRVSAEFSAAEVGSGLRTFVAWTDPYNTVAEQNESNNTVSRTITVSTSLEVQPRSNTPADQPKPTPTPQS